MNASRPRRLWLSPRHAPTPWARPCRNTCYAVRLRALQDTFIELLTTLSKLQTIANLCAFVWFSTTLPFSFSTRSPSENEYISCLTEYHFINFSWQLILTVSEYNAVGYSRWQSSYLPFFLFIGPVVGPSFAHGPKPINSIGVRQIGLELRQWAWHIA